MGSVSDPGGVFIPPGWTQTDITNSINTTQTAYNSALSALNNKITQLEAAVTTLEGLRDTLFEKRAALEAVLADPNATQAEIDAAQAEYDAALAAFLAGRTTFETRRGEYNTLLATALNAADLYASALARQQLFTQNLTTDEMSSIVSTLLSTPSPQKLDETSLPEFPWISQTASDTLAEDISERNSAGLDLINAFNAYRYLEYQISQARAVQEEARLAAVSAYLTFAAYPTPANETAYNNAVAAFNAAHSTALSLESNRASALSALNSAISTFQTEFAQADDPLLSVISTIQTFVGTYDDAIDAIKAQAAAALGLSKQGAIDEGAISEAEHLAEYPDTSPLTEQRISEAVQEAVERYEAISSLTYGREIGASSIPQLPPSLGQLSMNQLMQLLSQVQLMIQELIRQTADADRWIRSLSLRVAVQSLSFYTSYLQASDLWNQQIRQADINYSISVDDYNTLLYETFVPVYNAWADNIDLINETIEEVNDAIEQYNANVTALVDGTNTIRPDIVDAINAVREDVPHAPNVLDFFDLDPDIVAQAAMADLPDIAYLDEIPPFNTLSSGDLPDLPYETLPSTVDIDGALITPFNDQLKTVLVRISPLKDLIIAALAEETGISTGDLDIEPLYFRKMIGVRDKRDKIGLFESMSTALLGMLVQVFFLNRIGTPPSPAEVEQLVGEVADLFSVSGEAELRKAVSAPGVSFAIGTMGLDPTSTVAIAINTVMSSELFAQELAQTVENAGIFAGLQVAGVVPEALQQPSVAGMPITEVLQEQGINISEIIAQQSTQSLLFAYAEQLATAATEIDSLREGAVTMLEQFPDLALSEEQLQELIDILIAMQQLLLLMIAVLMGLEAGATASELIALILGPAADEEAPLTVALEALGIPIARARELAALVAGRDELQTALIDLGLNLQVRTILLALISAAQGRISLTEGVPGGAAFQDTLIAELRDAGITITAPIDTPDFLAQILAQLEAIATTEEQREILRRELLDPTFVAPLTAPLAERLTGFVQAFPVGLVERAEAPLEPIAAALTPSAIFEQITAQFARLPEEIRTELVGLAGDLAEISGVPAEQAAALLLAIRLGFIAPSDASLLLTLYGRELAGVLSDAETEIIRQLFAPREEEARLREERRVQEIATEEVARPHERPSTVPIQTIERLQRNFRTVFRNYDDARFARVALERFATTVEQLHDFNTVVLDLLLDPGRNILKNFSLITRSGHDPREQPQIFFGG